MGNQPQQRLYLPEENLSISSRYNLYGQNSINKGIDIKYPVLSSLKNKQKLSFIHYSEYQKSMETFINFFNIYIPKEVKSFNNKKRIINQIENSYFNLLTPELNSEKLFNATMAIYHRIGSVYGATQNYPLSELKKITFPLIAKYLSCDFENENQLISISDKIIKRTNFLSEEFPFKLYHIINIIQSKCCFIYGYDEELNLNFYLLPYNLGVENNISFIDYIIYFTFINEIILSNLKKKGFQFSDKINIIISFNGLEPNTELISFIMIYINNYFPLMVNKMHIVNYNISLLKKNITFQESLDKIDYFRLIYFHNNKNYSQVLSNTIKVDNLPIEFGGNAKVNSFDFKKENAEVELYEEFAEFLAHNIFCEYKSEINQINKSDKGDKIE